MTRETLDETLDRVAAEITAVPPDDTFVVRFRPRLEAPARHAIGLRTFAVAACLLAVAIAASLIRNGDSGARPVTTTARSTSERPTATALPTPPAATEVSLPPAVAGNAPDRTSGPVATRVDVAHIAVESVIPALPPPSDLDVAHMTLDPLVVQPVEVSSLEIAGLSVTDLGSAEDPKE